MLPITWESARSSQATPIWGRKKKSRHGFFVSAASPVSKPGLAQQPNKNRISKTEVAEIREKVGGMVDFVYD